VTPAKRVETLAAYGIILVWLAAVGLTLTIMVLVMRALLKYLAT
jgi:hypothetical protein